ATTAVALSAAAVAVMAPWRTSGAGATYDAAAVSTPSPGSGSGGPVDAGTTRPAPGDTKESPADSRSKKTPKAQTHSPPAVVSEPPPSSTPPTKRPVRTPDVKKSTSEPKTDDKGTVTSMGEDDDPPPQETQPKWQCRSWVSTGSGTGVEMSPCMAMVGDVFHLMGRIRSAASVRSDVHVQLYNTDRDANVSQPFICNGVAPPQDGGVATCGPFTVTAPRIGAKHDVRQRWKKAGAASFSGGAESPWVLW
ncbi:MAG: hypothetical protein HOQ38_03570, partial [Nonomuraea sp.]|nr:hypothetical protein [Nonomuraea sp.]